MGLFKNIKDLFKKDTKEEIKFEKKEEKVVELYEKGLSKTRESFVNKLINLNVTGWDTSSVGTDAKKEGSMSGMFYGCSNLNKLDVSNWNTSNVTSMNQMFWGCKLLKPIFVGESFKILETSTDVFTGCATENEEQLCEPNSTEEWCVVSN